MRHVGVVAAGHGGVAAQARQQALEALCDVERDDGLLEPVLLDRASERVPQARLLVAPRHPERFASVPALVEQAGFRYVCRGEAVEEFETLDLDESDLDQAETEQGDAAPPATDVRD